MTETWVIKDNAPVDAASWTLATTNISFTTNNQKATSIGITSDGQVYVLVYGGIGEVAGYDPGASGSFEWNNEAYKTLEFDTAPTGELLTWLQANGETIHAEIWNISQPQKTAISDTFSMQNNTRYICNGVEYTTIELSMPSSLRFELSMSNATSGAMKSLSWESGDYDAAIPDEYATLCFFSATTGTLRQWLDKVATKIDQTTDNYGLFLIEDETTRFLDWRLAMSGKRNSNMKKIDSILYGKADSSNGVEATLTVSAWTGDTAPYTQNLAVSSIVDSTNGLISVAPCATDVQREAARAALLSVSGQSAGQLSIVADGDKPEIDIPVYIILLG